MLNEVHYSTISINIFMTQQDYISISIGIATLLVTWFAAVYSTKKNIRTYKLKYGIQLFPIIGQEFYKSGDLKIYYKDELLPEPTLLTIDIINSGNAAIERPPIEVEAIGATYIIPGYIEDIPSGYENKWTLERTGPESCAIKLEHLNPGQVVKARFFLDENPIEKPVIKCAMKDLTIKEVNTGFKEQLINTFLEALKRSFFIGRTFY